MPDMHPTDGQIFPVKPEIAAKAHITASRYQEMFERAAAGTLTGSGPNRRAGLPG